MGGFAKYPWPQYISNAPYFYNKHYKRAIGLAGIAILANFMIAVRLSTYHHMTNPGYGSFIDPEHPQAPEQIKMI